MSRQIVRIAAPIAVAAIAIGAASIAGAEAEYSDGARCRSDALRQWYCVKDPQGSAVVDQLGRIVCAPGECVKQDMPGRSGWLCSTMPGGRALASPAGPVCDGECRAPEATACDKV